MSVTKLLLCTAIGLAMLTPAQAQKKDPATTTTGKMEEQRRKEMEDWKAKGDKYFAEQAIVQKKRKDCSLQAKEQKLHFKKRRDFIKQCMS